MVLGKYIKLLLDERKQVILPGFGNLEVKEPVGALPDAGEMLSPPGIKIRFDSGFSKDDKELAAAVAGGEHVEEEEAHQQVLELVDAIKFALDKGEPYAIPGVGSFVRDSNGKVIFRKDTNWILEPGQFGLEPLDLLELDEAEEIVTAPEAPVEIEADESFAVEPQKSDFSGSPRVATATRQRPVSQEPYRTHKSHRWRAIWFVAGALIVVLVVLILIPADNINIPGRKSTPPPVNTGQDQEQQPAASGQDAGQPSEFESLTPESLENEPAELIEEPVQDVASNKYFLIAGSFSHLRNASDLQDRLKASGVSAEVMITENRMYRVSVGAFPTVTEAEKELARIQALPGLESCWILSN
jgi:cell division septation protein DedD/nucleoid DNA-binding protein